MKRFIVMAALVLAISVSFTSAAFAWGTTGGDGTNSYALQETAVFLNNSGAAMTSGMAVILDLTGTGVTTGTYGAYVTTTTSADSILAVGIVKSRTAADQTPVVVITKGPAPANAADATDLVTIGSAVGTTSLAGQIGGGTNLGVALTTGYLHDGCLVWIWVDPTGAD